MLYFYKGLFLFLELVRTGALIVVIWLDLLFVLCSMAVGNPAKIVGFSEDEDPSFTMKHGKYNIILCILQSTASLFLV